VQEVTRNMTVTPIPTAPPTVVGIANMKGRVVTILDLAALLRRGRDKGGEAYAVRTVSAVIFKPFAGSEDQMGLLIDKPGDLIEISEKQILPPPLTIGAEEKTYILGIAEVEENLYRIINIHSIVNRFKDGSKNQADTTSHGGADNVEQKN